MENLLESNERTLVMLDSVCVGLSSCLALVHADIKQMTEHRNKLAQLEQEQLQAKLVPAQELVVVTNNNNNTIVNDSRGTKGRSNKSSKSINEDDDPHHLAGLKLLDKRLADSFSQAFSLNDLQKSSLIAKQQSQQTRPSIFQVLLGKSHKSSSDLATITNKKGTQQTNKKASRRNKHQEGDENDEDKLDNRMIIDDINRQTRLAMQYAKQLEAHLFKVEDLRTKYEMHLKMGLVVKSVSRAYLPHGSPGSLARRHHHCSSLVINDSSSSMGTRSSLSSLNLSTWSSSRGSKARRTANNNEPNNGHLLTNNGQMYVSTMSLSNKQNKRLNLAKLISPGKSQRNIVETSNLSQQHYADSNTLDSSRRRVNSSHSMEQSAYIKNYAYPDWALPTTEATTFGSNYNNNNNNNNDTLSKSNINLNVSHGSLLKGSSGGGGGGKSKNQTQINSTNRTTIKEFIENIDRIEAEFESFMGSFLLAIEDIQGFARVCQGDVFEISIKYGDTQKFKTKISVLKDNRQKCDNNQTVFKARIADVLAIKAYECKGLGKRVLLGHKLCETRDLFTARSQLMTISLNQTGSIKLNLIITWNPLHLTPSSSALPTADISHISLPPTPVSSSTLSSLSSVPSINGTTTTINIKSQNGNRHSNKMQLTNDLQPQQQQQHEHSMYQTVDANGYGYYIPPPDYLTNELKYREA